MATAKTGQPRGVYSVHVRTRKFRNPEKTKRYVVPAPRANSKTQGGIRIDSDSICHRHRSVFRVFRRSEYSVNLRPRGFTTGWTGQERAVFATTPSRPGSVGV